MIEQTLHDYLQGCEELAPYLAVYDDKMAIFNLEAPTDEDPFWNSGSQYGRMVSELNMADDPERGIAGVLNIHYYCEKTETDAEKMEPIIRSLIDGYFFSTEDLTVSMAWNVSNHFTTPNEKIIGASVSFNVISYQKHSKTDPDPIGLMNEWTYTEVPGLLGKQVYVIGHETLPPVFKPTEDKPAIYWRHVKTDSCDWIPDTWSCCWYTATLRCHVLAPEMNAVAEIIAMDINSALTRQNRLMFKNRSPMFVGRKNHVSLGTDPQRSGQLTIEATYGVVNRPAPAQTLQQINITEKSRK